MKKESKMQPKKSFKTSDKGMFLTFLRFHQMLSLRPDFKQALEPQFVPSKLTGPEHDLIVNQLHERCHSNERLHVQGMIVPISADVTTPGPSDSPEGGLKAADIMTINPYQGQRRSNNQKLTHKGGIAISDFKETPAVLTSGNDKRKAVAIDCEMVTLSSGSNEVAFLSAVDFLTGETLINLYVKPSAQVRNWNTPSSGITPGLMNRAIKSGQAIMGGWLEARALLWRHIDASTVLVGHSISNDLNVLGMIHTRIVDSGIMTAEAVFNGGRSGKSFPRLWSLKTLANDFLGYQIQARGKGHSALEDAHATREVVIWCIRHPEEFKAWVDATRQQEVEKQEEIERAREDAREHSRKAREELEKARGDWPAATDAAGSEGWENPVPTGWDTPEPLNEWDAPNDWEVPGDSETGW